ncbi:chaperonin HslO [Peptostreptococcaceae bacterium AS15]|nr:chaperonin HslO [Peptostreptococcaceae bacterium AS15]
MDYIINATDKNRELSVFVAKTTDMVNTMRSIHNPTPVVCAAIGRSMTATSIMAVGMKGEKDKITTIIKGDGPIGNITCVSNHTGNVKVCATNYNVDLPLRDNKKLDVGRAVGVNGSLTVIKDLGLKEPYIGNCQLISGEIAEDYTNYLLTSEQIRSAVGLGVLVDVDYTVRHAGGFIVYVMPFADEDTISRIENNINNLSSVTDMMKEGKSPEDIADILLSGLGCEVLSKRQVSYECDCSKDRIEKALISLGEKEIENIYNEDKKVEVQCHFCNKKYNFDEKELLSLIKK